MPISSRLVVAAMAIALATRLLPAAAAEPLAAVPASPAATAAASPRWQVQWNLRLRHEGASDAAFAHDARADTLRARLGLRGEFAGGWRALLEGEAVASAGHAYNSGANGRSAWPAIADPAGAEWNQAWIGWHGARSGVTLGRQRIALDNQRWVGNVGWRQNEQTVDALSWQWQPRSALSVRYLWLDRVHRPAGDRARDRLARERDLDTHLANLAWQAHGQQLVGYAYLHRDQDVRTASTRTLGLRWSGSRGSDARGWGWSAEAARQRDYANPLRFAHAYWLLEPALRRRGISYRAGWEHLGGNGRHALQTPLATLHLFNGWTDKFAAATPADGLDDYYLGVSGKAGRGGWQGKLAWQLAWHDYRADRGGGRYGREWDASLGFPLGSNLGGLVKYADYRSDGYARDTRKLWLQLEWTGAR